MGFSKRKPGMGPIVVISLLNSALNFLKQKKSIEIKNTAENVFNRNNLFIEMKQVEYIHTWTSSQKLMTWYCKVRSMNNILWWLNRFVEDINLNDSWIFFKELELIWWLIQSSEFRVLYTPGQPDVLRTLYSLFRGKFVVLFCTL